MFPMIIFPYTSCGCLSNRSRVKCRNTGFQGFQGFQKGEGGPVRHVIDIGTIMDVPEHAAAP